MILKIATHTDVVTNKALIRVVVKSRTGEVLLTPRELELLAEELPKTQLIITTAQDMMRRSGLLQEDEG